MTVLGSGLRRGGVSYVSVVCRVRPCVTVAHADRRGGVTRDMARAVIHSPGWGSAVLPGVCVCARPAVACSERRRDGVRIRAYIISDSVSIVPLVPSTHRRTSYHPCTRSHELTKSGPKRPIRKRR